MFLTQISEGGILSIYDKTKMMCRTWIEAINNLFSMGKELEESVDGMKGGIVKDVTLTEVDKHYTLTILYDDNTSDTVTWDDSTVGIEDITLTYNDGVYILTIILEDGTRYNFSIPVGNVVTEEELTALNLGTPDDEASATGSLWARIKDAVSRITTNEGNITSLQTTVAQKANSADVYTKAEVNTLDGQNVKKTGTSVVTGDIQVPTTPANPTSVVNSAYVNDATEGVNNIMHKSGNEIISGNKTFNGVAQFLPNFIQSKAAYWTDKNVTGTYSRDRIIQILTGDNDQLGFITIDILQESGQNKRRLIFEIWNPSTQTYEKVVLGEISWAI